MRKIKIGSRASKLAIIQAEIVMDKIREYDDTIEMELVTIKTTGDKILNKTLDKIGGKGLFIKELEQALMNCEIDIAVHSYKDMPFEEIEDLPVVALSKREDPRDCIVYPLGFSHMVKEKPIGSSSIRRTIQIEELFKGIETKAIRGNVISRIAKMDNGEFGGIILAVAGLKRLGLEDRISRIFSIEEIIPSASQGILAVQGRKGEDHSYLNGFHDLNSKIQSTAEREVLRCLNGGCSTPVGVYADLFNNEMRLIGMYITGDKKVKKSSVYGDIKDAKLLGQKLSKILKEVENESYISWSRALR